MAPVLFSRYKEALEALLQWVLVSFGPRGDRAPARRTVGQPDMT
jgi:hypothetical protein